MKHPIQNIDIDDTGVIRFRPNPIVRYILDNGGIDMNRLAMQGFDNEDQQQFAQLIGYSLGGYSELSYVSDEAVNAAELKSESTPDNALEIAALEKTLADARKAAKVAFEALSEIDGVYE